MKKLSLLVAVAAVIASVAIPLSAFTRPSHVAYAAAAYDGMPVKRRRPIRRGPRRPPVNGTRSNTNGNDVNNTNTNTDDNRGNNNNNAQTNTNNNVNRGNTNTDERGPSRDNTNNNSSTPPRPVRR